MATKVTEKPPKDLHPIDMRLSDRTYNTLKELTEYHEMDAVDELVLAYIYQGLESHLTGSTTTTLNISEELGAYIAKKNGYNPTGWRES